MFWIYEIAYKSNPTQRFIGIREHIDKVISANTDPDAKVKFLEEYKIPLKYSDKKFIIAGTGRAGTTFIVQLLTRLNYFTGYIPHQEALLGDTRGGCEFGVRSLGENKPADEVRGEFRTHPFIIKTPTMSWYLKLMLSIRVPIGHVLIPVRDHEEVAISRIKENLAWPILGKDVHSQILANDIMLGKAVEACMVYGIPFTLTRFPDIVMVKDYCYDILNECLSTFSLPLNRSEFSEEFDKLADPSMIKYTDLNKYRKP